MVFNVILEVMPELKFSIYNFKFAKGYSLIELLVVISIFGITATLVTASYLNFEKNQRIKNAALQLKNDIRFVQNKAWSGDKSSPVCPATKTLVGWFVTLSSVTSSNTSYTLNSDCKDSAVPPNEDWDGKAGGANSQAFKTINLPKGVLMCSLSSGTGANIFFQPLTRGVTVHSTSITPPFFKADGTLQNQLAANLDFQINLTSDTSCGTAGYGVVVTPVGEVYEKKLP